MFSFQWHYYVWIIWIIVNFFANFGRFDTLSISKIAVKSHKLCVKTSFWYIREIVARLFNQQGEGCQRFCYVTKEEGILLKLRTITREGEGRPNFRGRRAQRVSIPASIVDFYKSVFNSICRKWFSFSYAG